MQELLVQDEKGMSSISPAVTPLRRSASQPPFTKAVARGKLYPKPYANDQQNSRLSTSVSASRFRVRWQSPLNPGFEPSFVLTDASRIVVQAAEWQMLDLDGHLIASDRRSFGPAIIDASSALMYYINPTGYLVARELGAGTQLFNFLPQFGDSYARTFIGREGQRMLIAGVERPRGSHGDFQPTKSIIEAFDLGDHPVVDDMGFLTSLSPRGSLIFPSVGLQVAGADDELVAAVPDRIYFLDRNLKVKAAIEAELTPLVMSLDETGRLYLVSSARDRTRLWLITPAGEEVYSLELPPETNVTQPPVVGYDHTAYLIAGQQIIAVNRDGKVRWSKTTVGLVAGASVMVDDNILAAEGDAVTAYNSQGERRVLFQASGEELVTPPILTARGEILVASKTHLYCLSADTR